MFQFWPSVIKPILDSAKPRRLIEIGTDTGRHSRYLVSWAKANEARLDLVDPEPDFDMSQFCARNPDTVFAHHRPSLDVLHDLLPADVVLIDGDHNWYTVYHELQTLYGPQGPVDASAPITICHDVEWPYGRRDLYYKPDRIPKAFRQEARIGGVAPREKGLSPEGHNANLCHAVHEGGPRNGVRTAIEDFVATRAADFRIVWLPLLFGLAVIVPRARLGNPALEGVLDMLELSRPLQSLCKVAELDRVDVANSNMVATGAGLRPGSDGIRSFASAIPDAVLVGMLKGCLGFRYKGRSMLLNPLDLANYLDLLQGLRPASIIEIGSLDGGRTEWLADTMASLCLPVRVISVDLNARSASARANVDARIGDARDLHRVLPPEEVKALDRPLLVIEDSAHDETTCAAVLGYFDPLLVSGDYIVIEDGAFRSERDIQSDPSPLSPPSRAVNDLLTRRAGYYQIDTALCDRFGYNATFNPNGWLKRL